MTRLERVWMCAVCGFLGVACANDGAQPPTERAAVAAFASAGSAAALPEPTGASSPEAATAAPAVTGSATAGSSAGSLATTPGGSSVRTGTVSPASATSSETAGSTAGAAGSSASPSAAGSSASPPAPAEPPLFPEPSTPESRVPSPDNPPECPAVAPENPIGDCIGLPVYVECVYGTYYCVCDWVHWLCAG